MNFDNFTIKLLKKEDTKSFFSLINNNRDRIAKYFSTTVTAANDIHSTGLFVSDKIKLALKKESFYFLILDTLTKKIAGTIILKNFDWNVLKCEISYFIDKEYEGKGITTKALKHISEYCFKELKLNKVFLRTAKDNLPSRRAAEKNGFEEEGILRQDFKLPDGNWIDVVYYGLLNPFNE